MAKITKSIWILSLISLFTDAASEMLYPILPIYLKTVGFSVLLIGILEGIAEAVAGLSKGYFGKWSDLSGKRVPFVQLGYSLSAIAKPLQGLFIFPFWIFFARTVDRLGKGIRTGARDAILSDEATAETKGRVFGFHRSMDTLGAVIGPSLALLYLWFYPENYRELFLLAFLPGIGAVILSLFLKEKTKISVTKTHLPGLMDFLKYWKESPVEYKKLLFGLLFFSLFNSSDVFLLLQAKESGLNDSEVIGMYIFYNLIYALFAYPIGILADKLGLKNIFIFGLLLFSIVYFGMAFSSHWTVSAILFLIYGIYAASTEGVSKAWISNIAEKSDTATAIGTYTALQSIAALISSSMAGLIWYFWGAAFTFIITASAAIISAFYLFFSSNYIKKTKSA